MKLTAKQRKDIVKFNINQTKSVINEAERVNKGMHVHDISATLSKLKASIKGRSKFTMDDPQFLIMCKLKKELAFLLFLNEKGIK